MAVLKQPRSTSRCLNNGVNRLSLALLALGPSKKVSGAVSLAANSPNRAGATQNQYPGLHPGPVWTRLLFPLDGRDPCGHERLRVIPLTWVWKLCKFHPMAGVYSISVKGN